MASADYRGEARLGYRKESVSRLMVLPRAGVSSEEAARAVLSSLGPRTGFHPEDGDALRWFEPPAFLVKADSANHAVVGRVDIQSTRAREFPN